MVVVVFQSVIWFPSPAMLLSWGWQSANSRKKALKMRPIIHTAFFFSTSESAVSLHDGHFDLAAGKHSSPKPPVEDLRADLLPPAAHSWERAHLFNRGSHTVCHTECRFAPKKSCCGHLPPVKVSRHSWCFLLVWSQNDALNLSFSGIAIKNACINPHASDLKTPDFPRVVEKLTFQLLEISHDLFSLNKNRIVLSVLA